MSTDPIAPVTALGIVCTHTGDSFGQRCYGNSGSPMRVRVTEDAAYWSVSVHAAGHLVAMGMGPTLADADAKCAAEWAGMCEAVAASQAQTAAPVTDDALDFGDVMHRSPTLAMVRRSA